MRKERTSNTYLNRFMLLSHVYPYLLKDRGVIKFCPMRAMSSSCSAARACHPIWCSGRHQAEGYILVFKLVFILMRGSLRHHRRRATHHYTKLASHGCGDRPCLKGACLPALYCGLSFVALRSCDASISAKNAPRGGGTPGKLLVVSLRAWTSSV